MESPQPKKRYDKCDEINTDTIIFDDNKSVQTQRNDNFELELYDLENIDKDVYELTDTLDDENKVNNLESIETNLNLQENIDKDVYELTYTLHDENKVNNLESIEKNLNLDIFEKWMVKIFPPLKLNFLKLSNYSEDENISNEDTYARLIIILFFITVVLCFITFGQIIWISDLSRGPIVVQPFIPKINNPFCK